MTTGSTHAPRRPGWRTSWVVAAWLVACQTTPDDRTASQTVVFPATPARPRVQLLATLSDPGDVARRGAFEQFVTGRDRGARPIQRAAGLGLRGGLLYVCDGDGGALEVIDLREQSARRIAGSGESRLVRPESIAFSPGGRRFVADVGRAAVLVYGRGGAFEGLLEAAGETVAVRARGALAATDEHLFVADPTGHAVHVFDPEGGERQATWGWPGAASELFFPVGLAPGTAGSLWVSDLQRGAVHQLGSRGELLRTLGRRGDGRGEFRRPAGVAADSAGRVYVADERRNDVQVFDAKGRPMFAFGGPTSGWDGLEAPGAILIDAEHTGLFADRVLTGRALEHLVLVGSSTPGAKVAVFGVLDAGGDP